MVKADYWDVDNAQVVEKTGHPLAHWKGVLGKAGAVAMKSNDVVALLQTQHGVPRYWARTLTTWFSKQTG
jgi:hypothetical protein